MAETKHTPGPWVIYDAGIWPGIDGQTGTVIIFGIDGEEAGVKGDGRDDAMANARLIAAAPELLAALIKIVKDWDGEPEDVHEAALAITKATGES